MSNFTQIPDSLLVPGMYQEIDNSLAGTREEPKKILLIGSFNSITGTAKDGVIERVTSTIKAYEKFGYGSNLSIMAENFLAVNKENELYALPVLYDGIAFSQKYKVELKEATTGNIKIKVNTNEMTVSVVKDDTAESIAGKITASVNSVLNLPITATVDKKETQETTQPEGDGEQITTTKTEIFVIFTAISKGDFGIIFNIESDTSKIALTSSEKTDASDSPITTWKKYFEAMGETRYNYIINSFNDANTLKSFAEELESRYSALRQIGGRMFVYLKGDIGDTSEENSIIGRTLKINSPHIVVIPILNTAELPIVFLTRISAVAITSLIKDPASNTWGIEVSGISADKPLNFDERQALLKGGVATYTLNNSGTVLIERLVTSYTTNAEGERDTSYLDIQVVETVDAIRSYINTEAKRKFKGWKLASTTETFGAGAKVMNAEVWKSFLCELYQSVFIAEKQWAQDFNSYKDSLTAQVKSGTKTWLEYTHQPNLIGQFYIGTGLNQFK